MNDSHVKYDVFISYNRSNSAAVELLASYLANTAGLRVWMDKSLLQPGNSWRAEIEAAMNASASVLIAWGTHGLGQIQLQERDLAYVIRDSRRSFRVFYCLLPNSQPPQGNWANVDTWIRFSSSLDEADALANVVAAIKGEAPTTELNAELPDEPAPFRGLAAFGVDDVKFFHGRSAYVDEMAERLRHHPFLSLLGPSGCGKTSLLQAGFAARLQAEAGASDHRWRWLLLRPGLNPLRALALAVARLSPSPDPLTVTDNLFRRLKMKPDDLPDVIQSYLPLQERWLLAVDRLEEVFILCEAEEERQAFLAALIALVRHPHQPAWVVTAMRADFYSQVGRYTELADEIVNHQVYLRPMKEREVAEIIEAPVAQVGAIFEKGLAEQVRADAYVRGEVSLPLLQHALDLLWRKRRGRWLTWDAYLKMGGVAGALRYHADRVVEGLNGMERETARRVFIRLIWLDETMGTMAGRRTGKAALINQASPSADDERVLQRLADERLVVLRGHGEQATAELIHDTLPLNWELLRGWVQEDRDFLLWQQRLRADFAEWERMGRDEGGLLRGRSLNEAERWLVDRQADLNHKEREFIDLSLALRQQEQSVRERLRRRITFGLAAGLLIALALAGLALNQTYRANLANNQTRARRLADQAVFLSEAQLDLALLLSSIALDLDPNEESKIFLPRLLSNPHLLSYLHGHRDTVTSVAFHPLNNGMLASASDDGTVIIWDVTLRQPLAQPLGGAPGQIWCMAFSPDGKMLVTGGQNGAITSWDVSSRPPTDSLLTSQSRGVTKLAFSQDGRTLAAGLADGKILLWDIAARRMLGSLNGEANGRVYSMAFRPDGKMLAAGYAGNIVTIWDVYSRQLVGQPLAGHDGSVRSVEFSPDGKILASGGFDRKIIFWEVKPSGQAEKLCVKEEACKGGILSMGFHPDGKRLVTSDDAYGITLWKVKDIGEKSGACEKLDKLEDFNLHTDWVGSVAFSPDGKMLASASRDKTIILWNLPEDHEHLTLPRHPEPVLSVAFSSDGKTLATSSDTIIRLWNIENHELRYLTGHQDDVLSVAFPRDGKLLASGSKDGSVILWDTEKLERLAMVEERRDGWVWSVAFSPDSKLLAAGGTDLKINLFDVTTRQRSRAPLEGHNSLVFTVAFSPDNHTLASGSDDGEIILWDVTTGTRKASLRPDLYQADQDNSVLSLAFSPDGKTLASGYRDKTIILWDVQTQRSTLLKGHKDSVRSLAFSPDGKLLASGDAKVPGDESNSRSKDSDVILWNLASLQPSRLKGHSGGALSLAFSPNQKKLASGGEDRTVILWDVGDNRIKDACRIANRNLTQGEWTQYVGSMPNKLICPDLPPNGVAAFREKIQAR